MVVPYDDLADCLLGGGGGGAQIDLSLAHEHVMSMKTSKTM